MRKLQDIILFVTVAISILTVSAAGKPRHQAAATVAQTASASSNERIEYDSSSRPCPVNEYDSARRRCAQWVAADAATDSALTARQQESLSFWSLCISGLAFVAAVSAAVFAWLASRAAIAQKNLQFGVSRARIVERFEFLSVEHGYEPDDGVQGVLIKYNILARNVGQLTAFDVEAITQDDGQPDAAAWLAAKTSSRHRTLNGFRTIAPGEEIVISHTQFLWPKVSFREFPQAPWVSLIGYIEYFLEPGNPKTKACTPFRYHAEYKGHVEGKPVFNLTPKDGVPPQT